jgi:hypothetical protein
MEGEEWYRANVEKMANFTAPMELESRIGSASCDVEGTSESMISPLHLANFVGKLKRNMAWRAI